MAQRLFQAWGAALAAIVRDKGVLLLLIGAPVLYGFFYPWFYADEVLTRVLGYSAEEASAIRTSGATEPPKLAAAE